MKPNNKRYIPITPGGTPCTWLASDTEDQAWERLLKDAAHMPYKGKAGFIKRGYTIEVYQLKEPKNEHGNQD